MSALASIVLTACLVWTLAACSSGSSKLLLPDGLHRVPVNRVLPTPDVSASENSVPPAPDSRDPPASSGAGAKL
jgi:hypothetical protein